MDKEWKITNASPYKADSTRYDNFVRLTKEVLALSSAPSLVDTKLMAQLVGDMRRSENLMILRMLLKTGASGLSVMDHEYQTTPDGMYHHIVIDLVNMDRDQLASALVRLSDADFSEFLSTEGNRELLAHCPEWLQAVFSDDEDRRAIDKLLLVDAWKPEVVEQYLDKEDAS